MSFEQLFQEIKDNTTKMSQTLDAVKSDTGSTLEIAKTKSESGNTDTEQARNLADTGSETLNEAPSRSDLNSGQIVSVLEEIRDLISEQQDGEGGPLDWVQDFTNLGIKIPGLGKQTGGFVYPSPIQAFQSGGGVFKVPGNSTGDNHNMLLPQGSFVLNRNAAKALSGMQTGGLVPTQLESQELVFGPGAWSGLIPALNKAIPRFQTGGIIEHLHGDPNRSGFDLHGHGMEHNAHDHFAFESPEIRQKVQEMLASGQTQSGRSYQIGSTLRPNDTGSHHSTGKAFDIPWSQFGSGKIGEKDFEQSRTLAADVKAILNTLNGPNGAKGSGAGDGNGQTSSVGKLESSTGSMGSSLFTPEWLGISNEFSKGTKQHNDVSAEFFDGYTSDVHSSMNSQFSRHEELADNVGVGGVLGSIAGILSGGGLGALALLGGGIGAVLGARNEQGENPFGNMFQGLQDSVNNLLGIQESKAQTGTGNESGGGSRSGPSVAGGEFSESALIGALDRAGITDKNERAMFLAQMAHESGNFRYSEEIHDGSNYEGRSDLGNNQAGDGKRFKGRGYIQLTGRSNYTHFGKKVGHDLVSNPELAKNPNIAADIALEYWKERVDRNAARKGDVLTVTKNINGGTNGLKDRQQKFKEYSSQGLQSGGTVGLEPVKVESGELIFPPGSYGSEIPMLNEQVPRFQGGGMTGSLGISGSNVQNFVSKRFSGANESHNEMRNQPPQPVVIPMPMSSGSQGDSGSSMGGGAPIPSLTSAPSNHIVSSLMMSSYSLMQRIG